MKRIFSYALTVSAALVNLGLLSKAYALDSDYVQKIVAQAQSRHLAFDPQWLRLVHYRKSLLGGYTSEIDGSSFFLSPDGKGDPEKELLATIYGIFQEGERSYPALYGTNPESQHPRCQLPARFLWLQKTLQIDPSKLPVADCSRYEKFKTALAAKSVSVVFSSFYLNNPSSAFGHSFIRINKAGLDEKDRDRFELLDYGISYAAEATTDNSLAYAVYGLTGLFRGTYANVPYYYKVREYNDYESRDIWSYDLNLTSDELQLLAAHMWEVGATYSKYFYLKRNCSYEVLRVIEAAAPRLELSQSLWLYAIPSDTIKQLTKVPGLVANVHYRPSARSLFSRRLADLNDSEKDALYPLFQTDAGLEHLQTLSAESKARVLDAALDYVDYKHPENLVKPDTPSAQWRQKLLVARAGTAVTTSPPDIHPTDDEKPQLGHGSGRIGLETGHESGVSNFTQLNLRFALHDLMDPSTGYPRNSQIEFANLQLRQSWASRGFEMESFTMVRVTSINPVAKWNHGTSWRVEFGARRIRDQNCDRCLAGDVEVGFGYAAALLDGLTGFALADGEFDYSPGFYLSNARVGAGPRAGFVLGKGRLTGLLQGAYHYLGFSLEKSAPQATGELRWSISKESAIFIRSAAYRSSHEGAIGGFLYF
ncbi:MAG: DUF4105 domain-containing protein [Bdellovibrionia bacterium]